MPLQSIIHALQFAFSVATKKSGAFEPNTAELVSWFAEPFSMVDFFNHCFSFAGHPDCADLRDPNYR
jgi:hypothetical protein